MIRVAENIDYPNAIPVPSSEEERVRFEALRRLRGIKEIIEVVNGAMPGDTLIERFHTERDDWTLPSLRYTCPHCGLQVIVHRVRHRGRVRCHGTTLNPK